MGLSMAENPEEFERLIKETNVLVKENNRLLKAIRRDAWIGLIFRMVLWAVILLVPLYLYMAYLSPVMDSLMPFLSNGTTTSTNLPSADQIRALIEEYGAGQ